MEERKRLRSHGPPGARVGLSGCSSERHQSGCAADAVEEKCTIRLVSFGGGGSLPAQCGGQNSLSASVLRQSPLRRKKKALLALALLVFWGGSLNSREIFCGDAVRAPGRWAVSAPGTEQ